MNEEKADMLNEQNSVETETLELKMTNKKCEELANDFDAYVAEYKEYSKGYLDAIEILRGGSTSNFLQVQSETTMPKRSESDVVTKAMVRSLIAQHMGDKESLIQIHAHQLEGLLEKNEPLVKIKQFLKNMIGKLLDEQAEDNKKLGKCAVIVAECETLQKHQFKDIDELVRQAEEFSDSVETKKVRWTTNHDIYKEAFKHAHKTKNNEQVYNKFQCALERHQDEEDHSTLKEARNILTKQLPSQHPAIKTLAKFQDEVAAGMDTKKKKCAKHLADNRSEVKTNSAAAAEAKTNCENLAVKIKRDAVKFRQTLDTLQETQDASAKSCRCVQEHKPCGNDTNKARKVQQQIMTLEAAVTAINDYQG